MLRKINKRMFFILIMFLLINIFFSNTAYADNESKDIGSFSEVTTQGYNKNHILAEKDAQKFKDFLKKNFSYNGALYTSGIKVKLDFKLEDADSIGIYKNNTKLQNINLVGIKRTKEDYGFLANAKAGESIKDVTASLGVIDKSSGDGFHYYTLSILAINQDAENAQLGEKIKTQEEKEQEEKATNTDIDEFIIVQNTTYFGYQNVIEKEQKKEIEMKLEVSYNYTGEYKEIMKLHTEISYDKNHQKTISIGTGEYQYKKTNVSENNLERYGRKSGDTSTTWEVVLIAKAVHNVISEGTKQIEQVKVTAIYPEGDPIVDKIEEGEVVETGKTKEDKIVDAWNSLFDFANAFEHNPAGTLTCLACDVTINLLGDICQTFANFFQTGFVKGDTLAETIRPKLLPVFTYDYLKDNPGYNDYTNVSKEKPKEDFKGEIIEKNNYGFTDETKIPVVIVDLEAIARNKINTIDANFFVEDKDETHSSIWIFLRNTVVIIIRIVIFLSASLLLTVLIINAIGLASSTLTPAKRKKKINIIQNFVKSVIMLVSTVVIMAIGLYLNQMIFNVVDGSTATSYSETKELPMRVYVEEAGYTFSTTTTGYLRYMASISNVDKAEEKTKFAFTYLIYAISNLLLTLIMFARMIAIFGLAIIGPIIVIQDVIQELVPIGIVRISYKKWATWFLLISAFQALLAAGYAILNMAF